MPYERVSIGGVTAIVCTSRARKRAKCFYCKEPHTRLCDRKLCDNHARPRGEGRDLCPDHDTADHSKDAAKEASVVKLAFYTGNVNAHRHDPDALDITIMTGGPKGRPFAPSMGIFVPARRALERVRELRLEAEALRGTSLSAMVTTLAEAERIETGTWAMFRRQYLAEMLVSSGRAAPEGWESEVSAAVARGTVPHIEAWTAELSRKRRVYTCFCKTRERCHRSLLASILAKMGADDLGELQPIKDDRQLSLIPKGST